MTLDALRQLFPDGPDALVFVEVIEHPVADPVRRAIAAKYGGVAPIERVDVRIATDAGGALAQASARVDGDGLDAAIERAAGRLLAAIRPWCVTDERGRCVSFDGPDVAERYEGGE